MMSKHPVRVSDGDGGSPGQSCELLGETALVVQALMGILVLCSLAYKRQRESPKRPWRIWLFDVSKQVVGQLFVHGANVLVSDVIADLSRSNACVFYFLNVLLDTTLGVALLYFILQALSFLCTQKLGLKGFESGKYGNPPTFQYWARQTTVYVIALTSMKFLVILLLALFPGLIKIGAWILSWTWTSEGDSLQVIFVMGIFPIVMNVLQFWLIDTIVKDKTAVILEGDAQDAFSRPTEQEPLFSVPSDEEEDDRPQVSDLENQRTADLRRKTTTGSRTPHENKSSGPSTPGETLELHEYPPSVSHTLSSTSSSSQGPLSEGLQPKVKHTSRSPSPLRLQSSNALSSSSPIPQKTPPPISKEWEDGWADSNDWNDHRTTTGS